MAGGRRILSMFLVAFMWINAQYAFVSCTLTPQVQRKIARANQKGPYLGLIIPNTFELDPLLQNSDYTPSKLTIDFAGRRFRFGAIGHKPVILVMTGMGMINAGVTTQLLLSLFTVEGVVHYGVAGNANPSLHIGDVAIPQYWAHLALWSWQRYGQGPNDSLPFDFTKEVGYLEFANYTSNSSSSVDSDNQLNNIWYEPEEVFPVDGIPEETKHALWVPVDSKYYHIAQKLKGLKLKACINSTTCLSTIPKVELVDRGTSASIYLDNVAYRTFLYNKFNVSPVDMESASVALICLQQRVPFIVFRALSDLAGGGSAQSNEADTFASLAATNSVTVVVEFVKLLSLHRKRWNML